jgi:hypothetical protein
VTVRPSKNTITLFYVDKILTNIGMTVWPSKDSKAIQFVILPRTFIGPIIALVINTTAMYVIGEEFTLVYTLVSPT